MLIARADRGRTPRRCQRMAPVSGMSSCRSCWPATFLAIVVTVIGALRSFDIDRHHDRRAALTGQLECARPITCLKQALFGTMVSRWDTARPSPTVLFLIMDCVSSSAFLMRRCISDEKDWRLDVPAHPSSRLRARPASLIYQGRCCRFRCSSPGCCPWLAIFMVTSIRSAKPTSIQATVFGMADSSFEMFANYTRRLHSVHTPRLQLFPEFHRGDHHPRLWRCRSRWPARLPATRSPSIASAGRCRCSSPCSLPAISCRSRS